MVHGRSRRRDSAPSATDASDRKVSVVILPDDERSRGDLAAMAVQVAAAVDADAIICATHDGRLPRQVRDAQCGVRLIGASHDAATRADLAEDGFEVVAVSMQVADKYLQARVAMAAVLNAEELAEGDLVVCVVGHGTSLGGGDLVVVADLDEAGDISGVADLASLVDGVSQGALQGVLDVASQVAQAAGRGKRIGALFVIGDSNRVLEGAHQLVMNPFQGHDEEHRRISDRGIHESLVELAKLDGAFVLRGDGLIRRGGVFLASGQADVSLPAGLGARHTTAAAVTARTAAAAIVVSATDGAVRVFTDGELVMHRRPDVVNAGPQPRVAR